MSSPPQPPDAASRIVRQLAELWGETDLIAALRRGADLLAAAAGGVPSALFLLTDDGIAAEAWASDESARDLERRARFQRAALEGPHADPRHFGPSGAAVTRRTVPSAGNARATLAWVCGARAGAEDHASGRTGGEAPQAGIAASILDILVARAASLVEMKSSAA